MRINKKLLIILLIGLFIFYLIPYFATNMNEVNANNYATFCILFINSTYVMISSFILTKYCKFRWYYILLIIMLFIPSVILYFNTITIIYSLLYVIEYLIGSSLYIKYINR